MKRPKRENYDIGKYGDIDYQNRLESYCTYLENKNKALTSKRDEDTHKAQLEQLKAQLESERRLKALMDELNTKER